VGSKQCGVDPPPAQPHLAPVPQLHLTKVAVGCASLEALRNRIARRAGKGVVRVATRMRPKRAEELIGGSLHWIVKHRIIARQQILRLEDRSDGRIDIVCSDQLVILSPVPKRAHQGWRYLETEVSDEADPTGVADLPPRLYGKLAALALV
jgi:hypothetical protein